MFKYTNVIVFQWPTVFSTGTCCAGLMPGSNRPYYIARHVVGCTTQVCARAL